MHANAAEPTRSAILKALVQIEKKSLVEYVHKNNVREEMEKLMKSFFDKNREYLPENPYPEITKRLRHTEVRYMSLFNSIKQDSSHFFPKYQEFDG